MLLGGRTAEELVFADPTTGAQNDIERATTIARPMVTEYGMSDALGPHAARPAAGRGVPRPRLRPRRPTTPTRSRPSIDAEVRRLHRRRPRRRPATILDRATATCSTGSPTRSSSTRRSRPTEVQRALRRRRTVGRRDRRAPRASIAPEPRPAPSRARRRRGAVRRRARPPGRTTRDRRRVRCDRCPRPAPTRRSTRARIERAVREILEAIGEDPDRDGSLRTPGARRATCTRRSSPASTRTRAQHLTVTFEADHDEMVMVRDIPLLQRVRAPPRPVPRARPTSRTSPATTAASPGCRRSPGSSTATPGGPQVQERLTTQIADALVDVARARRACSW